jgi:primase-polymerase (primpol)-like protein
VRGEYQGIGYVLRPGQIGLDLDGCYTNGLLETWAKEILEAIPSFAEKSVNDGAHLIADSDFEPPEGQIEKDFEGRDHYGIAFYVFPRFFAMTGARLNDCEITDQTEALDALHLKYFPQRDKAKPKRRKKAQAAAEDSDPEPEQEPAPVEPLTEDDHKLLAKARSARNGAKFARLWDDQWRPDYEGDPSRADAALLRMLAFWAGRDPERLERLFSQSKLGQREKWQTRAREVLDGLLDFRVDVSADAKSATVTGRLPLPAVEVVEPVESKGKKNRSNCLTDLANTYEPIPFELRVKVA